MEPAPPKLIERIAGWGRMLAIPGLLVTGVMGVVLAGMAAGSARYMPESRGGYHPPDMTGAGLCLIAAAAAFGALAWIANADRGK